MRGRGRRGLFEDGDDLVQELEKRAVISGDVDPVEGAAEVAVDGVGFAVALDEAVGLEDEEAELADLSCLLLGHEVACGG